MITNQDDNLLPATIEGSVGSPDEGSFRLGALPLKLIGEP